MSDGGLDLSGSVDLPLIGKQPKSNVALGLAVVGGVLVYAWWKYRSGAGGGSEDPAESDYYADLRTGSAGKDGGYVNPGGIEVDEPGEDGDKAPRTNQEWAARVMDKLTWYEQGYVSSTISKYLDRQRISKEAAAVVREAWAQVGRPPEGDIPILLETTPVTPLPPKPPSRPVIVPKAPTGLKATKIERTSVTLDWAVMPQVAGYQAYVNGQQFGRSVIGSDYRITGLKPGRKYTLSAACVYPGSPWKTGPKASITVTTKK